MTGTRPPGGPGGAPVGLYVHVPFCRSICSYCAFAKGEFDPDRARTWLDALASECDRRAAADWDGRPRLDTVFVGGGTPSTLPDDLWLRFGDLVRRAFALESGVEFTAEANPESLTPSRAAAMRAAGVNRLSLGAQSFDGGELAMLRRAHDADAVARAVGAARDAGFENLNLDLMYGLPGQSTATFARTLERALALGPDHLSAYCLGLEPGTDLAAAVGAGSAPRPDDDVAREQYDLLVDRTGDADLVPYEISNFARPGRACRHNLRYWKREAVIGLGPSAHGFLGGRRWANPAPFETWAAACRTGALPGPKPVDEDDARFEWIFLHLRLMEGLNLDAYAATWGEPLESRHGDALRRLLDARLLVRDAAVLRLARDAWFVSDAVFAEFAP